MNGSGFGVRRSAFSVLGSALLILAIAPCAGAQVPEKSCDAFLLAPRQVKGQVVGPKSCLIQETAATYEGRALTRLDVGLDGTVDGYLAKIGNYKEYFSNSPDLVFPQTWGPREIFFGVAAYERARGASMTIVFPRDRSAWNGKMWVTAHGRGTSFKEGQLKVWNTYVNPANGIEGLDRYDLLMIAKGYALVKTRRTSTEGLGEIITTLEDGSTVDYAAFNDTSRYIMDFADVAKTLVADRLGRPPSRVYLYGHSAGARIGHATNYAPGLNVGRDGKRFFDGILGDDPAAGTWYPVVMKDGKDVLLSTDAEKAAFVTEIDVAHQMYNNIWEPKHPDWMSNSYLENKRTNARILRDKGITNYRMYEVRGVSHAGGETLTTANAELAEPAARSLSARSAGSASNSGPRRAIQNLDLAKAMDRFIDLVDAWADQGSAPPPTHSDWAGLGDANHDGTIDFPALAFPEIACPLGIYFSYPESTSGTTSFAAFTGEGLEPLDAKKGFVDMNRNGVWDSRETPTQAWRRLGLLQKTEELTREKYVACVQRAAGQLRQEGFFSDKTAASYVDQAKTVELSPKRTIQ
jgi:alpha/beta hydrolase family protein